MAYFVLQKNGNCVYGARGGAECVCVESRKTEREKDLYQNKEITSQTILMNRKKRGRVKQPSRSCITGFSQFDAKMCGRRRPTGLITMPGISTAFFSKKLLTHGDHLRLPPPAPLPQLQSKQLLKRTASQIFWKFSMPSQATLTQKRNFTKHTLGLLELY